MTELEGRRAYRIQASASCHESPRSLRRAQSCPTAPDVRRRALACVLGSCPAARGVPRAGPARRGTDRPAALRVRDARSGRSGDRRRGGLWVTEELPGCFHGVRARAAGRQGRTGRRQHTRARAHARPTGTHGHVDTRQLQPPRRTHDSGRPAGGVREPPRGAERPAPGPAPARPGPAPSFHLRGAGAEVLVVRGPCAWPLASDRPARGPIRGVALRVPAGAGPWTLFTCTQVDVRGHLRNSEASEVRPLHGPPRYQSFCVFSQKRTTQPQIYASF